MDQIAASSGPSTTNFGTGCLPPCALRQAIAKRPRRMVEDSSVAEEGIVDMRRKTSIEEEVA